MLQGQGRVGCVIMAVILAWALGTLLPVRLLALEQSVILPSNLCAIPLIDR